MVGHRQVGDHVTVEVAHRHGDWIAARPKLRQCTEGAITFAQEHRQCVTRIRHRKIGNAVTVEISHRHGISQKPAA